MADRPSVPIPKAELHLHIEGTLEPELALAVAERNRLPLPYADAAELRARYQFHNLQSFLDVYYETMDVLRTEEDFADLAGGYLDRARAQGVRHAEIFFDPQAHIERGVPMATVVEGLWSVLAASDHRYGITSRLIMCFLRDRSLASAMEALESALPYRDRIVAVGLDSAEVGHPPSEFVELFDRARQEGFRCVAHAGEEGPSGYIWEALDLLRVDRIDHGNRCMEDPALVARLREEQVPLTVCPLSNLRLGAVGRVEDHPLLTMLDAGLLVTVNSDDPAYFGGYIDDNYRLIQQHLGIDDAQLLQLAGNSFRAAFLSDAERARYLTELEEYSPADR
ncbi:MAG: adenosine deaminase [Candidatus Dormibacteria bacterium]